VKESYEALFEYGIFASIALMGFTLTVMPDTKYAARRCLDLGYGRCTPALSIVHVAARASRGTSLSACGALRRRHP